MADDSKSLNAEQKKALSAILNNNYSAVYIDGGAGSGKSFVIREAKKVLEKNMKNVEIVAPTGIAAENVNGTTLHSLLKSMCVCKKIYKKKYTCVLIFIFPTVYIHLFVYILYIYTKKYTLSSKYVKNQNTIMFLLSIIFIIKIVI